MALQAGLEWEKDSLSAKRIDKSFNIVYTEINTRFPLKLLINTLKGDQNGDYSRKIFKKVH